MNRIPFQVTYRPEITLDLYGDYDEPKTSLSVVMTADLAALESRAAELEAALRALCAHTYKCYRSGCNERATRFSASRGFKVCDAHGPDEIDMQYARQLRAALLLLAKGWTR